MRPQILNPGTSGLPGLGFYPEISGFFEAVGIFFFFFLKSISGVFGDLIDQ